MSETKIVDAETVTAAPPPVSRGEVATFSRPRLPYHPLMQERYGVDIGKWRALIDAIWPGAQTTEAVGLALSYCKARNLDPFKRPVHIVPIWSKALGRMVESVWPGVGELRTTAFRTGLYAGRDEPKYGPEKTEVLSGVEVTYPEWCQITAYRLGKTGERMPFPGPRVYWIETYATAGRNSTAPNDMWRRRPFGQIEKCAEAAALRAAFPEEIGNEYAAEEMHGQVIDTAGNVEREATPAVERKASNLDRFEERHGVTDIDPEAGQDQPGAGAKPEPVTTTDSPATPAANEPVDGGGRTAGSIPATGADYVGNGAGESAVAFPSLPLADGPDPLLVPLPKDPSPANIAYWRRQMEALVAENPDKAVRARIKIKNEHALLRVKALDVECYRAVLALVDGRDLDRPA